jgi:hypothetical protein
MNADIPYIHCWVRLEHISDAGGVEEAYAFAIQSIYKRALGFHVMLKSGAHYRNVPLHALTLKPESTSRNLNDLAYWDCFSNNPKVTVFDYLREHECYAFLPDSSKLEALYMFTVDWLPDDAVRPGFINTPDQNKCGHVVALEDGNIAILPTNKIAWRDGYFIGSDPKPQEMKYTVQSNTYQAESCDNDYSKSDKYYY